MQLMKPLSIHFRIIFLFITVASPSFAQNPNYKDLEYAKVGDHQLLLDLYLPQSSGSVAPSLVLWVHGGAWRAGSKANPPIRYLLKHNFAIASIDYRLSTHAPYPALLHDCKAAIRWLRAHQKQYQFNADKIAVAGSSAGGHLAALIGVTNGSKPHEGKVGKHLNQSSDIQAIVDYYGPTNFLSILHQSTPHGLSVRVPALQLLLGSQPEENPALAKEASPTEHVDPHDPPLLMLHGDQDPQVPINQSHELHHQYKLHNLDAHLEVIHGGKHGGPLFYNKTNQKLVIEFLNLHIL